MKNVHLRHLYDLEVGAEELDLFAEEVDDSQQHNLPPNSFSSLGCECELSTFFCFGCGYARTAEETAELVRAAESLGDVETALRFAREKLNASAEEDEIAAVFQTVFRFRRRRS